MTHIFQNISNNKQSTAYTDKRKSNLELLRIVAMLLVLLIHYVASRETPSPLTIRANVWDTLFNLELRSISFVCVNCFVLISGYFGIKWKLKSFSNLVFQIVFWLLMGVAISGLFHLKGHENWISGCFNYLSARWFISAYICLYIVAPLINAFIEKASQQSLGRYILFFYLFSTIYGYLCLSKEFNEGMSMISLVGIYMTGAYLRRYKLTITSFRPSIDLLIYFSLGILLLICNVILLLTGISKSLYGYLNPLVILSSIYLFLFFSKIDIGYKKWINYVAASAFAVYLFHMHPLIYGTYQDTCTAINALGEWTLPAVIMLFTGIFVFCTLIDHIRILLFKSINNISTRFIKRFKENDTALNIG